MDTGFVGNPSSDQAIINTTKIEDSWDRDMMTCEKMTLVYKMGETIYILFNIYGRRVVMKLVSAREENWLCFQNCVLSQCYSHFSCHPFFVYHFALKYHYDWHDHNKLLSIDDSSLLFLSNLPQVDTLNSLVKVAFTEDDILGIEKWK